MLTPKFKKYYFNPQQWKFPIFSSLGTMNGLKSSLDMRNNNKRSPRLEAIVSWALKQIPEVFIN